MPRGILADMENMQGEGDCKVRVKRGNAKNVRTKWKKSGKIKKTEDISAKNRALCGKNFKKL